MSQTWEQFTGSARSTSVSTSLTPDGSRVLSCHNSSSINVTLPALSKCRIGYSVFRIVTAGSGQVVLKDSAGLTVATIAASRVCVVSRGPTSWVTTTRVLGAGRTLSTGARGTLVVNVPHEVFVDCSNGDGCDQADDNGNVPLDGTEGRDLVVAKFIQDMSWAANYNREPVRAADLIMPRVVLLGPYSRDDFAVDPDHPHSAVELNENFWAALENGGKRHALIYVRKDSSVVTRHWMHIRYGGVLASPPTEWYHSASLAHNYTVERAVWARVIQWTDDNGALQTLTLRFVMETKMDGSKVHEQECLLGSGFTVSLMTSALDPAFSDGDSFQPFGASGGIAFTYDDPVASGGAQGVSVGGIADKWYHPHMLAHGALVLSLHSPINADWLEPGQREFVRPFEGVYNYPGWNMTNFAHLGSIGGWKKWRSDVPWVDTSACEQRYPATAFRNVTFGRNGPDNMYSAGYTRGGGFPKSKPMEFVCWENGGARGRTYFVPVRAGWGEEDCGELDVEGGSVGGVILCVNDEDGTEEGGVRRWPVTHDVDACTGHPDELVGSVGGSHTCFRTSEVNHVDACCIMISGNHLAGAYSYCRVETGTTTSATGSCVADSYNCTITSMGRYQYVLYNFDYTYGWHSPAEPARELILQRVVPDPDYVLQSYAIATSDLGLLSTLAGSWTKTTTALTATANNSVLQYTNPDSVLRDTIQTGKLPGSFTVKTGGFSRRTDANNGYFWEVTASAGTCTARIYKRVAGVETTLKTDTGSIPSTDFDFEFKTHGDTLTLTLALTPELIITDFDNELYSAGYVGVTGNNGSVTKAYACEDMGTVFKTIDVSYGDVASGGPASMIAQFPLELQYSHAVGGCEDDGSDDTNCILGVICDCEWSIRTTSSASSFTYVDGGTNTAIGLLRTGEIPCSDCITGECDCSGCILFGPAMYVQLETSCWDIDAHDGVQMPDKCGGYQLWHCPVVACL